jgi:hypothetical protein
MDASIERHLAPALPQDVDASVADNAGDPCHCGAATGIEGVRIAPYDNECVLHDFLSDFASPEDTQREAEKLRCRSNIEAMQCRLISVGAGLQQCLASLLPLGIGSRWSVGSADHLLSGTLQEPDCLDCRRLAAPASCGRGLVRRHLFCSRLGA